MKIQLLFAISFLGILISPIQSFADEIDDLCNPQLQMQILEDIMSGEPDNEKLSKAAEYILFARSTFERKGLPVPSIEAFCEQFKRQHKNSPVAFRLTQEIMKKKDMDPQSFFLPIKGHSVQDNPYFEDAVNDCMWGLGEAVMCVFFTIFGNYSTAAVSAGASYQRLDSAYHKMEKARDFEDIKRQNNINRRNNGHAI